MIINKRNKNTYIYDLLDNNDIVRHVKFIKNNYENNSLNTISQKLSSYNNNMIVDYFDLYNNEYDHAININDTYDSVENIKTIINDSVNQYNSSFNENANDEFTAEEKNNINDILSDNSVYIRLGIDPNKLHNNSDESEHIYFIKKLYETTIADYFNEFDNSAEYQNKLLDHKGGENLEDTLSPMFNDLIIYSNKKYEYLNNLFENLNNENNE